MNRKLWTRIPLIPAIIGLLGILIILILLYIIPGRYHLYQNTLYDPLEETPANPLMGFAPRAEEEENCKNTRLVLIDLSLEDWEPEKGEYDIDSLEDKYHIKEYMKNNIHGVLRFDTRQPENGEKRKIKAAISALGDYFSDHPFISYIEIDSRSSKYAEEFKKAFPNAYLVVPTDYEETEKRGCGVYFEGIGEEKKLEQEMDKLSQPSFWEMAPGGGALSEKIDKKQLLNKNLAMVLQDIRDGHLTYISDNCPNAKEQKGNGSRMISQTLGYCIYINRLQTTVNFRKDMVNLRFTFINTGVAPCYADWPVIMTVYNHKGKRIYEEKLPFSLKEIRPGEELDVTGEFPYNKKLTKGYSIGIRICNPDNSGDYIRLSQKETQPDDAGEHIIYKYEPDNQREKANIARPDSYQNAMINLLGDLSDYAKSQNPDFAMITNGGYKLYMPAHNSSEENLMRLTSTMDGMLIESIFYGWEGKVDRKTPDKISSEMQEAVKDAQEEDLCVFNIEYSNNKKNRAKSAENSRKLDTIWYNAIDMELTRAPELAESRSHDENCNKLEDVENFIAVLNPDYYKSRTAYLKALRNTNYDMLFIDTEYAGKPLTRKEIDSLRTKKDGGKRLVCAYLSVGEAENYRDYWQESWNKNPPPWICEANDEWEGDYKVMYWTKAWRDILFGSKDSCLDRILAAGFDGAYLDVVDAYEYFEEQ